MAGASPDYVMPDYRMTVRFVFGVSKWRDLHERENDGTQWPVPKRDSFSPFISEAEMSGDYDEGYFAEGEFWPFDNDPKASEMPKASNNNRASRFEVHHIDGDKSNNRDSNLEYLCKRCHIYKHRPDEA